ncbi:MAG: hypothetical protein J0I41_02375 [Filimonas sp.]|nr:hypothetical protein [Filimonas sp.]
MKSKNLLIGLLLVALAVSLYFNYVCCSKKPVTVTAGKVTSGGLIDSTTADNLLVPFQDSLVFQELTKNAKSFGVYFDARIINYFQTNYPKFVANHPIPGYEWQVGIYFGIKKDPKKAAQQLTVCLIPTAVNTTTLQAADYLTHKDFYYKKGNGGVGDDSSGLFMYDTGTMFP